MSEVISLQFGHCGNFIGAKFWELITAEHSIQSNGKFEGKKKIQLDKIHVYFNETCDRYVPRCLIVDLDPETINDIRGSQLGDVFNPDSFICQKHSASNNWAKGHYTDGAEVLTILLDMVRREAESCDCLKGFQITHSLGGGTGSGLGTLVISKLRDEYPDRIISTYSVLPSRSISDSVVEPYNVLMSMQYLINCVDLAFCFDNEGLYSICQRKLHLPSPVFKDLNHLVSLTMSGVTTCLRFPGQLNADLRKIAVNMVPFPKLHFFATAIAPLIPEYETNTVNVTISELTDQMFNPQNLMLACNPSYGKYFAGTGIFRGQMSMREVETNMMEMQIRHTSSFVRWIPNNLVTAVCNIPPKGYKLSGTFLGNNTAVHEIFKCICNQFKCMYNRKAFVHWFLNEGMEENELIDAHDELLDLISLYQQCESANLVKEHSEENNMIEDVEEEIVEEDEIE